MKVLIVNNMAPFVWGGAEEIAFHLEKNLLRAGHEAEILRIPFQWEPATRIPSQILMVRALELANVDHVVALKFPAYAIRHPRKTLWLLHQYRQAYDLFDAGQTNLPSGALGNEIRALIKRADDESFGESRKIFCNSEVTRKRLATYNGFEAEVLLPPINDPELFPGGDSGNYIFAGGRVNSTKRQHLLLEGLSKANKEVKLVVAGPPDSPLDAAKLTDMVDRLGIADRVKLDLRFLPREIYAGYINHAAAVAYIPFDEDSLGYVSMEAAIAGKPIITATDSGGVIGLVRHDITGWLADPSPGSLAEAMNAAWGNPTRARQLGAAAKDLWMSFGINWSRTIEILLG